MFGYQYILNPMTKRKVSVHTIKGKQIINNFLKSLQVAGSNPNMRLETLKQSASKRGLAPKPRSGTAGILRRRARIEELTGQSPKTPKLTPVTLINVEYPRSQHTKLPHSLRNKPPITTKPHNLIVKPTEKPIPEKLIREVTTFSKGTTDRLSAGEYYRYGGKEGDICDIRGDGELRCLIIGKNGTPSWKNITKNEKTLTHKTCGPGPWKKKCAISLEKK